MVVDNCIDTAKSLSLRIYIITVNQPGLSEYLKVATALEKNACIPY